MKNAFRYWSMVVFFAGFVLSAQASEVDNRFTLHLLTDQDARVLINGTNAVAQLPSPDRETLDVTAELLLERAAAHAGDPLDVDATAWLMRALGAGHDARYRDAVARVMAEYKDEKINEYGRRALAEMTGGTADSYVPGTVALPALRARLAAERKTVIGNGGSLAALARNTAIVTVLSSLGYPARFMEKVESVGAGGIKVRVRSLRMLYPGKGVVEVDNTGLGWGVTGVFPDVPNHVAPYTGGFPGEASILMTSDPMLLLKVAAAMKNRNEREPALLDRAAERLRLSLGTRDEFEASALAHLARVLGSSGDRKYADVLRATVAGAEERRLRRHAEEALAQLQGG